MYMHAEAYLRMVEQDRERMLAERALQRAAREGRDERAGVDGGGINAFTRFRSVVSSALHIRFGPGGATNDLTGTSAA